RESLLLSSPQGTEMFQFPWFPLPVLCVHTGVTPHDGCRVSPFGHPRIDSWSADPRGFSQPPTSFFGFRRQGIHRWLFVAWKTKMLVLAMEFSRGADESTAVKARSVEGGQVVEQNSTLPSGKARGRPEGRLSFLTSPGADAPCKRNRGARLFGLAPSEE